MPSGAPLELKAHMLLLFITQLALSQTPVLETNLEPPPLIEAPKEQGPTDAAVFARPPTSSRVETKTPVRICGAVTFGLSYAAFAVPVAFNGVWSIVRSESGTVLFRGLMALPFLVPVLGPVLAGLTPGLDDAWRTIFFIYAGVQVLGLLLMIFGRDEQILRWETKTAVFEVKPTAPQADLGASLLVRW